MGMESIFLEGAPDALIGTSKAKTNTVQIMHLEMSNDILDDLLECIRKGKTPQVLFGKTPLIKYDGTSHELHAKPEKFWNELYREDQENEDNSWEFSGLVTQSLRIQGAEDAAAGTDHALEKLKNTMASLEQDREARKAGVISTPETRPVKGMSKAQSRAAHLKPLSSPALGSRTPSHIRPPTSAGLDMPHDFAARKALVHYLAVKPRTLDKCRSTVHTNPRKLLEKIARPTGKGEEEWALKDQAYKDLDVFKFKYGEGDREAAIQNAIHAYDRMRLSKDDPLWQKLLPQDERGKGKILSRLHLKDPSKGTPALKPQTYDKKTGLPKKKEAKKPEKEGAAPKKKENGDETKPKALKSAAEARTPKVEPRKERQPVKRTAVKAEDSRTPIQKPTKPTKPSTAAKSLLNRPKNGSPLGASPPVNASDFEDGRFKGLSAATSPRKGTKRKAEESSTNGASKRPHIDSASGSSSEERPLKGRSTTNAHSAGNGKKSLTNGHRVNGNISPDSDSSSSSRSSPPIVLSWRQSIDLARKFNVYYQRYKKLYQELSQSTEPPSEKKREELLEMHRRLAKMKHEVNSGDGVVDL